jgi:hypothetical protein
MLDCVGLIFLLIVLNGGAHYRYAAESITLLIYGGSPEAVRVINKTCQQGMIPKPFSAILAAEVGVMG